MPSIAIPAASRASSVTLSISKVTSLYIANSLSYAGSASAAKASQAQLGITASQSITTTGNPTVSSHATQPVTLQGSAGYTWSNPRPGQAVTVTTVAHNMPAYSGVWNWAATGSQLAVVKDVSATYSTPYSCKTYSRTSGSNPTVLRSLSLRLPKRVVLTERPSGGVPLEATVLQGTHRVPASVAWSSSSGRIVSSTGLDLLHRPGTVIVQAKADGMTCAAAITVRLAPSFPWWIIVVFGIFSASVLWLCRLLTRKDKDIEKEANE
jgi:hypothetical protein